MTGSRKREGAAAASPKPLRMFSRMTEKRPDEKGGPWWAVNGIWHTLCPTCGTEHGSCESASGKSLEDPHTARVREAIRLHGVKRTSLSKVAANVERGLAREHPWNKTKAARRFNP